MIGSRQLGYNLLRDFPEEFRSIHVVHKLSRERTSKMPSASLDDDLRELAEAGQVVSILNWLVASMRNSLIRLVSH